MELMSMAAYLVSIGVHEKHYVRISMTQSYFTSGNGGKGSLKPPEQISRDAGSSYGGLL